METCPVCGYTSPWVIAGGSCPECMKRREAELGEGMRVESARVRAETQARWIAEQRHRYGMSHNGAICVMCAVQDSVS